MIAQTESNSVDDDISTKSNGSELSSRSQSVSESLKSETKRRRSRLQKLLTSYPTTGSTNSQRVREVYDALTIDEETNQRVTSNSRNKGSPNSIMTFRTQKESLLYSEGRGVVIGRNKRKRRLLRRRMKLLRKDDNDENKISSFMDRISMSSTSSVTSNYSDLSSLSVEKLRVKFSDVEIKEFPIIPGDNPS